MVSVDLTDAASDVRAAAEKARDRAQAGALDASTVLRQKSQEASAALWDKTQEASAALWDKTQEASAALWDNAAAASASLLDNAATALQQKIGRGRRSPSPWYWVALGGTAAVAVGAVGYALAQRKQAMEAEAAAPANVAERAAMQRAV